MSARHPGNSIPINLSPKIDLSQLPPSYVLVHPLLLNYKRERSAGAITNDVCQGFPCFQKCNAKSWIYDYLGGIHRVLYFPSHLFLFPDICLYLTIVCSLVVGFPTPTSIENKYHFLPNQSCHCRVFNLHLLWAQCSSHLPVKGEVKLVTFIITIGITVNS